MTKFIVVVAAVALMIACLSTVQACSHDSSSMYDTLQAVTEYATGNNKALPPPLALQPDEMETPVMLTSARHAVYLKSRFPSAAVDSANARVQQMLNGAA